MALADYIVLALYLGGMVAVGLYYAFRNTDLSTMFAAGGQSPWWVAGLSGFMTMFSAGTFVVWGGVAYEYGFVAVTINLTYGIAALLVGYFLAARWKDIGLRTPAQYVELRFGRSAVQLYLWMMIVFRIVGCAVALYALAILICALIPLEQGNMLRDPETGNLSVLWATLIFGMIIVAYTIAGGLWAVLMTDVLQFIILNLAVLFILPLILMETGGLAPALAALPDGFLQPTGGDFGWLFLAGWVAVHFFMIGGEWAFAQRFISVPNGRDAKKSAYLFGALYLISPILWLAPPLLYRAMTADAPAEQAYILAAQSVLPVGLVGLIVAAMFSATASLVSSQLNVFAGALSDPVAQRVIAKGGDEAQTVWIGRGFTCLIGLVLIAIAAYVPQMGGARDVIVTATSLLLGPLIAPTIWGMLTRRVGIASVWVAFGSSVAASLVFYLLAPEVSALSWLDQWIQENGRLASLFIGLIVPNVALMIMHFAAKAEAPGVARVAALEASAPDTSSAKASSEPLYVVSTCLGVSCFMMVVLGLTAAQDDRGPLLIFAATLAAVAIACLLAAKRDKAQRQGEAT